MRNRVRGFALFAFALVMMGGAWMGCSRLAAQSEKPSIPTEQVEAKTRTVEVVKPERRAMTRTLSVPAAIEAFESADLFAKTSGYVAEVRVDIGDRVKEGDVLAVLDVPEMADELRQAQAARDAKTAHVESLRAKTRQAELSIKTAQAEERARAAEASLQQITAKRKEELFIQRAIPEQELDEARSRLAIAETQVEIAHAKRASAEGDAQAAGAEATAAEAEVTVAEASIARLKTLMKYASITAPFDGIVTMRMVDRGALVQAATTGRTTPLLTIQRMEQLRIFIDVPESDIAFVHPGVGAKVEPYGLKGSALDGKVARIAASLNPETRTMRTEIDLPNSDGRLYDGMYAQVTLEIDRHENALTVPAAALLTEGKETYVFTARDDHAVRTPIVTGLDDGLRVEVTQGLDIDALVITAGKGLVSDNSLIKPVLREAKP